MLRSPSWQRALVRIGGGFEPANNKFLVLAGSDVDVAGSFLGEGSGPRLHFLFSYILCVGGFLFNLHRTYTYCRYRLLIPLPPHVRPSDRPTTHTQAHMHTIRPRMTCGVQAARTAADSTWRCPEHAAPWCHRARAARHGASLRISAELPGAQGERADEVRRKSGRGGSCKLGSQETYGVFPRFHQPTRSDSCSFDD